MISRKQHNVSTKSVAGRKNWAFYLVKTFTTIFLFPFFNLRTRGVENLPEKSAFIFGHEEFGISFNKHDYKDIGALQIPQCGRSQSLNVSVAASIVMYEYIRQHGQYVLPSKNT